ncbi:MAG: ferrous iron transport protein A [Candidatus Omnitrophica bacterium]|nr:ferrous iron transport protein A [Candidatus Omnitrophota bacterium]
MAKSWWKNLFVRGRCGCENGEKTLTSVQNGQSVRIECLRGEDGVCQRLREMGFCESAVVEKVTESGALICKVCDTRVAISRRLADNIIVKDVCQAQDHHHARQ